MKNWDEISEDEIRALIADQELLVMKNWDEISEDEIRALIADQELLVEESRYWQKLDQLTCSNCKTLGKIDGFCILKEPLEELIFEHQYWLLLTCCAACSRVGVMPEGMTEFKRDGNTVIW